LNDPGASVYVRAPAGRALRRAEACVTAAQVLDVSGPFGAGDEVYVVERGVDGGQRVAAIARTACDSRALNAAHTDAALVVFRGSEASRCSRGQAPVAMGRDGSEIHSLHEPA